jgi:endonuclease G, mitochondrial
MRNFPAEVIGPEDDETTRRARHARRRLREGQPVDPAELHELEMQIRKLRPTIIVQERRLGALPLELRGMFPGWDRFREAAPVILQSVARIDRGTGGRRAAAATGFLVGERVLLTNRHVARALTQGTGVLPPDTILVRFGAEQSRRQTAPTAKATGVLREHPTLDLALLELDRSDVPPVEFDTERLHARDRIAAVGYPSDDLQAPEYARALFHKTFGVERVSPGEVIAVNEFTFLHDCTTLAGNSGSPLVSLANGAVVGVHAEGYYLAHNEAVLAREAATFVSLTE